MRGTLKEFNDFVENGRTGNCDVVADNPHGLEDLANEFYQENADPNTSPNFQLDDADDYSLLMDLLDDRRVESNPSLTLCLLRILKVLSRKAVNRANIEEEDVTTVTKYLQSPRTRAIASEIANVVLNICYEKQNVIMLIKANGVPPLRDFLRNDDEDIQSNAAGALQSLSYQEEGRIHLREIGVLPLIIPLLNHSSVKVRTRCVGVIHNMSSDIPSIAILRGGKAIEPLVQMLSAPQATICSSAAGAIQNLSREAASKEEIVALQGIPPLTDLLFGSDVASQVISCSFIGGASAAVSRGLTCAHGAGLRRGSFAEPAGPASGAGSHYGGRAPADERAARRIWPGYHACPRDGHGIPRYLLPRPGRLTAPARRCRRAAPGAARETGPAGPGHPAAAFQRS